MSRLWGIVLLLTALTCPAFADIKLNATTPEYNLLKIQYEGEANAIFWTLPDNVSFIQIDKRTLVVTAPPGVYRGIANCITIRIDYENKKEEITQDTETFSFTVLARNPQPGPEPTPTPVPIKNIAKVALLYETNADTQQSYLFQHQLRQKLEALRIPFYLLDQNNTNSFGLTKEGLYFIDAGNKVISQHPVPNTVEAVLEMLK